MGVSMRQLGALAAALCLAAGCGGAGDEAGESRSGGGGEGSDPVCLLGGPFVADGVLDVDGVQSDADADAAGGGQPAAGPASEVRRITELRWHRYEGCERLVIDLAARSGEAAARPGEVRAEVLRDLGVVRVWLPEVEEVASEATDVEVAGPLARSAYVVTSPEGRGLYVDVHLGEEAEAFVAVLGDPARALVDLRPGGGPVPGPAPAADRVVVLEPRSGPASYPLTVTGYARTFEANVVVRLEQDGRDVYDDFTTATAWVDAWGHYSFRIPDGPAGEVTLHVGEYSARDGSWEGVAVPLELR